ncbi:MAG: pur operon repressor [Clostridiales bacterium]|nr:pur operon repressor [Clostridiales bacterium]
MDKIKRNERLAVMTQVLTASPNHIFTLSYFCDLFSTAKSTVSEDVAILQQTMKQFRLGQLETVTGAAGGVRYRPIGMHSSSREFIEGICEKLREPGRMLPGGYLYFSDILSTPELVQGMGTLIASQYYHANADFVLTMETKGIPVALMTAQALRIPLVIARRATKVYEGSAVNISYVSGSGSIESMALSRRAVKEGQRALIVDDFMRGGGTARGMMELMKEFSVTVAGICFVLALEEPKKRLIEGEKALMLLSDMRDGEPLSVRPADWIV